MITQPIKIHGGKNYLARRIIDLMPPRCKNPNDPAPDDPGWMTYVEPYAGGLAVLLAMDPEGISEVVNDKDGLLINFWNVIADPKLFRWFRRRVGGIPFSRWHWEWAEKILDGGKVDVIDERCSVEYAVQFFVWCRQSLAGRRKDFAPLSKNRTRRGMNEQASAWLNAVEGLPEVHERLKRVAILGPGPAVKVIHQQDGPRTLFYIDSPYYHPTRATTDDYAHEMTELDHRELLATITHPNRKSRFMISGYPSALYDEVLSGWTRHTFDLPNNAAGGENKRRMTECLWVSY